MGEKGLDPRFRLPGRTVQVQAQYVQYTEERPDFSHGNISIFGFSDYLPDFAAVLNSLGVNESINRKPTIKLIPIARGAGAVQQPREVFKQSFRPSQGNEGESI